MRSMTAPWPGALPVSALSSVPGVVAGKVYISPLQIAQPWAGASGDQHRASSLALAVNSTWHLSRPPKPLLVTGSAELCGPSGRAATPESERDIELFLVLGPTRSRKAHSSLCTGAPQHVQVWHGTAFQPLRGSVFSIFTVGGVGCRDSSFTAEGLPGLPHGHQLPKHFSDVEEL